MISPSRRLDQRCRRRVRRPKPSWRRAGIQGLHDVRPGRPGPMTRSAAISRALRERRTRHALEHRRARAVRLRQDHSVGSLWTVERTWQDLEDRVEPAALSLQNPGRTRLCVAEKSRFAGARSTASLPAWAPNTTTTVRRHRRLFVAGHRHRPGASPGSGTVHEEFLSFLRRRPGGAGGVGHPLVLDNTRPQARQGQAWLAARRFHLPSHPHASWLNQVERRSVSPAGRRGSAAASRLVRKIRRYRQYVDVRPRRSSVVPARIDSDKRGRTVGRDRT